MRYLGPDDLRAALPMPAAIDAMRAAFGDDREIPARQMLGTALFMTGRVGDVSGIKVVSTTPGDPDGIVAVFDAGGRPLGICDGPTLTGIRTGAASGLSTDLLARADAGVLAMLGAGAMAPDQVAAVRAVRPIRRLLIWSRSLDRATAFAEATGGEPIEAADSAVAAADIVCTATPATQPLFSPESVRPGTHINAIGAFTPDMTELPLETLRRAFIVVDDVDASSAEAGDLIQAGVTPNATVGELLGDGKAPSRNATTIFKSVGIASQDIAAATAALSRAAELGIGVEL